MNSVTVLASKRALTVVQGIFWGGLAAGVLDAIDGVIAYGTQGLNPIQVLQYIASGAVAPDQVLAIITEAVDAVSQDGAFDPQKIGRRA